MKFPRKTNKRAVDRGAKKAQPYSTWFVPESGGLVDCATQKADTPEQRKKVLRDLFPDQLTMDCVPELANALGSDEVSTLGLKKAALSVPSLKPSKAKKIIRSFSLDA